MTPKPCKWCGSIWHSKNKCSESPLPAKKKPRRPNIQLSKKKPVEGLTLAYKGKSKRSQLTGFADKYFGAYIRARGAFGEYQVCYTCSRQFRVEEIQCGHFMPRRYTNTRWHELNCWPQCNDCNVVKGGNLVEYEIRLRNQFGEEAIDALQELARSGDKFSLSDIESVVEKYKGLAFSR